MITVIPALLKETDAPDKFAPITATATVVPWTPAAGVTPVIAGIGMDGVGGAVVTDCVGAGVGAGGGAGVVETVAPGTQAATRFATSTDPRPVA